MKVHKKFTFPEQVASNGIAPKYPWGDILTGQIVELQHGEGKDFDGEPGKMRNTIRKAARKRGLNVKFGFTDANGKSVKPDDATSIFVQSSPATDEEKAQWAAEDQVRKENKKAKKAAKKVTEAAA
jgi:hypothetical protein